MINIILMIFIVYLLFLQDSQFNNPEESTMNVFFSFKFLFLHSREFKRQRVFEFWIWQEIPKNNIDLLSFACQGLILQYCGSCCRLQAKSCCRLQAKSSENTRGNDIATSKKIGYKYYFVNLDLKYVKYHKNIYTARVIRWPWLRTCRFSGITFQPFRTSKKFEKKYYCVFLFPVACHPNFFLMSSIL